MNNRYIIFADDDADDLELITGFFKQYNRNTKVLEFKDGKEVIKFLDDLTSSSSPPLLIVLDINMPRLNGRETLIAIRKNKKYDSIPIVIYTTTINPSEESYYSNLGASCVSKSTSIEGVRQTAKILAEFCSTQT